MRNQIQLDKINGFSNLTEKGFTKVNTNCLLQSKYIQEKGVILVLKNTLRFYNGTKSKQLFCIQILRQLFDAQNIISSITINGPFIAVGVKGFIGELVATYFFNIYNRDQAKKYMYQKTSIKKLTINIDGSFFCSIGYSDSKSQQLVIIKTQQTQNKTTKIFYSKCMKSKHKIVDLAFSNTDPLLFAILYSDKLFFNKIIEQTRECYQKVQEILIKEHKVREFTTIIFDSNDKYCYVAGGNGDVTMIDVKKKKEIRVGPVKRVVSEGIKIMKIMNSDYLILVGHKGLICLMQIQSFRVIREISIQEQILSMTDFLDGVAYIATQAASIYKIFSKSLEVKLFYTCIKNQIYQIAYCQNNIGSFATCSDSNIFIWNTADLYPQLRIKVPKLQVNSIAMDKYGKFIVSGWSDGCIRLFSAYNGKLIEKLEKRHNSPVTKVIIDYYQSKIISGSETGQIRAWNLSQEKLGLALGFMSVHSKRINQLKINPLNYQELMAAGEDGTYSIWNLLNFQLIYRFPVCNFLKDCIFEDFFTILLVGSGSYIYKVIKANGQIIKKSKLLCSNISSLKMLKNSMNNGFIMYGGQSNYLFMEELQQNIGENIIKSLKVYGEISQITILPDRTVLVGTYDGILLKAILKQDKISLIQEEDLKTLNNLTERMSVHNHSSQQK